ncbi:MAG: sulfatase [Gemmatimonadota bacterium]|nr:sulfatase [Gemmatimonadota bacterium]
MRESRPNILIFLCDQLRRQALSVYGDPNISTPHIDALAEKGVRFTNACSTYPICVPFRFTMITGEYAHTRKVPGIEYRMSPAERTVADEFNEAGYETIYVGKWHLDGGHGRMGSAVQCGRTKVLPTHQGRWEKWFGFELRNGPFDTYYFEDDDPEPRPVTGYQTDGLCDIAMRYLAEGRDASRPFCTVISVEPPHDPFEAPEALQAAWEAREISLPDNFTPADTEQRKQFILARKRYYAMVENVDWNVGRITTFLKEKHLEDNTVVMFLSDHGELNGSHGLRGKQWPFEESVGIPLIVYDPNAQNSGASLDDPVATEDLLPTTLGLAGLTPRNELPGTDLTDLIHGRCSRLPREGVMLEFVAELRQGLPFYDWVWRGFRTKRYKYTVRGDNMGGTPWQFFDLGQDPGELKNLIDDPACKAEIAQHHRLLVDRMQETEDHFVLLPAFGCEGYNLWE